MNNAILTIAEVAEYLKLSDKTIRRLIDNGEIKASKVGSSWRIKSSDIEDYLNENTNGKERK